MENSDIFLCVLSATSAFGAGFLWSRHLAQGPLRSVEKELSLVREERAGMIAQLAQERASFQEKLALIESAKEALSNSFQALSAQALERNNRSFLDLAQATFSKLQEGAKGDLSLREKAISELLSPIKQSLSGVDEKLRDLEKNRLSAYEILRHQVGELVASQKDLRQETSNLVKALRAPHVRGRWGEMQLKRVVEMSGMSAHCDFVEQASMSNDDGRLRPDMVVNLPGGKKLVIDAKAPLAAYLEALEAPDDMKRRAFLQDHARQVRTHINALSSKAYWDHFKDLESPEFVVLFLPGETFFSAALEFDPTLIELGVEKRVILATPATLIALLHAIAFGWRQETLAENAREISQQGKELYKRLCDMSSHFARVGVSIAGAVKSYNSSIASLESRVLPSARRFKSLQASEAMEDIPVLSQIEMMPRGLQAPELVGEAVNALSSMTLEHPTDDENLERQAKQA